MMNNPRDISPSFLMGHNDDLIVVERVWHYRFDIDHASSEKRWPLEWCRVGAVVFMIGAVSIGYLKLTDYGEKTSVAVAANAAAPMPPSGIIQAVPVVDTSRARDTTTLTEIPVPISRPMVMAPRGPDSAKPTTVPSATIVPAARPRRDGS